MNDIDKLILQAVRDGVTGCITKSVEGYGSPMQKYINEAIEVQGNAIRSLVSEAVKSVLNDQTFRTNVIAAINHKVARELVSSFGEGIFKKTIDSMKCDQTFKARCVLAIENIVAENTKRTNE